MEATSLASSGKLLSMLVWDFRCVVAVVFVVIVVGIDRKMWDVMKAVHKYREFPGLLHRVLHLTYTRDMSGVRHVSVNRTDDAKACFWFMVRLRTGRSHPRLVCASPAPNGCWRS